MYPENLRYTKGHEWIRVDRDKGQVGITHYAQDQLGDVVFVELPALGRELRQMEAFGVVESVKAVSDLYCPLSGEVVEVNQELSRRPELMNQDPYGAGWMIVIKMKNSKELENLMTSEKYQAYLETEGGR